MSVLTPKLVGRHRLMRFPYLDGSKDSLTVYTIGWRIDEEDEEDEWTERFNRFKKKDNIHLRGGELVLGEAVAELIDHLGLDPNQTGLTTALSSGSTKADSDSALYKIGERISDKVGVVWLPDLFTKEVHRPLHYIKDAEERDAEVHKKYTYRGREYRNRRSNKIKDLFILDDFVTRGATLGEMVRASSAGKAKFNVIGLALGKNESSSYAARHGVKIDNSHIPQEWDRLWKEGQSKND